MNFITPHCISSLWLLSTMLYLQNLTVVTTLTFYNVFTNIFKFHVPLRRPLCHLTVVTAVPLYIVFTNIFKSQVPSNKLLCHSFFHSFTIWTTQPPLNLCLPGYVCFAGECAVSIPFSDHVYLWTSILSLNVIESAPFRYT